MKNIILLLILCFLLFLFQTSFLVHFPVRGWVLNLIITFLILFNILEAPEKNTGILVAGVLGFFWDIFSEKFIGYHIIILVFLALLIKAILVRYVRIKIFQKA